MMPPALAHLMLRLNGMKLVDENGGAENWPAKCVIPTGPHTTNRDFPYGIYARAAARVYIKFVAKSSLFKFPLGPILRSLGGVPVIREKRMNFVQSVAKIFHQREEFKLCIAMEGTRKKVDRFKTGFYFIAREAGVPLVFCLFDFGKGEIRFTKPFYPSGNIREDFDFIYRTFAGVQGHRAENSFDYDPGVLDDLPTPSAIDRDA